MKNIAAAIRRLFGVRVPRIICVIVLGALVSACLLWRYYYACPPVALDASQISAIKQFRFL